MSINEGQLKKNLELISRWQPKLAERLAGKASTDLSDADGMPLDVSLPKLVHPVVAFFFGIGLGETLESFTQKLPAVSQHLCVVEKDLQSLLRAFGRIDLEPIYNHYGDRLAFLIVDREAQAKVAFFNYFKNPPRLFLMESIEAILHPGLSSEAAGYFRRIHRLLAVVTREVASYYNEHLEDSIDGFRHYLEVGHFVHRGRPAPYLDKFRGIPAVVISGGPSLDYALPKLAAVADRVVLIAADVCLKPCLDHGYEPHFVTSLDRKAAIETYLESPTQQTRLVAVPHVRPRIMESYGRRAIYSVPTDGRFTWHIPSAETFEQIEVTVAHLSFFWANYIGADPIIFVGQDLSFDDDRKLIYAEAINKDRNFSFSYDRMAEKSGIKVPGNRSEFVTSTSYFVSYKTALENRIAQSESRVINATAGGARIEGAEWMELSDALKNFENKFQASVWEKMGPIETAEGEGKDGENDRSAFRTSVRALGKRLSETEQRLQQLHQLCGQTEAPEKNHAEILEAREGLAADEAFSEFVVSFVKSQFVVHQNRVNSLPRRVADPNQRLTEYRLENQKMVELMLEVCHQASEIIETYGAGASHSV